MFDHVKQTCVGLRGPVLCCGCSTLLIFLTTLAPQNETETCERLQQDIYRRRPSHCYAHHPDVSRPTRLVFLRVLYLGASDSALMLTMCALQMFVLCRVWHTLLYLFTVRTSRRRRQSWTRVEFDFVASAYEPDTLILITDTLI